MSRDKIAVIIPCYNEALTIGKVIDDFRREISEATVEKQEEALRKKRSLSSRCPSYKNSAPAGRQIKQTEDTGFETPTKPHGILGRLKGLFDKFRK